MFASIAPTIKAIVPASANCIAPSTAEAAPEFSLKYDIARLVAFGIIKPSMEMVKKIESSKIIKESLVKALIIIKKAKKVIVKKALFMIACGEYFLSKKVFKFAKIAKPSAFTAKTIEYCNSLKPKNLIKTKAEPVMYENIVAIAKEADII